MYKVDCGARPPGRAISLRLSVTAKAFPPSGGRWLAVGQTDEGEYPP